MQRDSIRRSHEKKAILYGNRCWVISTCAIVAGTCIANLGTGFELTTGISQQAISVFCKVIIVASLIACVPSMLNKRVDGIIKLLFIVAGVIGIQTLLFPGQKAYFTESTGTFLMLVLPMCICMLMVDDFSSLLRGLYLTSVYLSILVVGVVVVYGGSFFERYNMGFSASLIIPVNCLLLYGTVYQKGKRTRWYSYILAAALFISILLYGSRGACGAIAAFCCVLLFKGGVRSKKDFVAKMAIVAVVIGVIACADEIIGGAYALANWFSFHSRTLELLVAGQGISNNSGRSEIWRVILEDIAHDPLAVRGINSEYSLTGGLYAHNFVIELWHNLGVVLGTLAVVMIVSAIVRTLLGPLDARGCVELLVCGVPRFGQP